MTQRDLDEALLHGLATDADLIALAPADMLAPHLAELERIRDNLTRAFEKARAWKVAA